MRLLARNKQTVYYRNYISQEPITTVDEWGNTLETGEAQKTYSEMKSVKAYVKSAVGTSETEPFGDFTEKNRTIYLLNTDMDIHSQVWIGIDPEIDEETGEPTVPHNFNVLGISHGLNHVRIRTMAVEVSG